MILKVVEMNFVLPSDYMPARPAGGTVGTGGALSAERMAPQPRCILYRILYRDSTHGDQLYVP